jgi:hypothetical protein
MPNFACPERFTPFSSVNQCALRLATLFTISFFTLGFWSCQESPQRFTLLDPEATGIQFANHISENDTFNILAFEYVYNGGGIATGDFNGDGKLDVYFTGNTTANQLYLNGGQLSFTDVTEAAGVAAANRWCTGVTTVDINADGRLDLYVSASVYPEGRRRRNLLYVNQGNKTGPNGVQVPVFAELGAAYGLADTSHTTQAAFFDYDRDGDLDVYLVVNEMTDRQLPNRYRPIRKDGTDPRNDRLLRNDPGPDGHPVFTDVTVAAGLRQGGFGLGISICDLNQDAWPDVYVTNDYISNDLLWINQQDGTFREASEDYFKHTAYSAMGNDVADLNGDGLEDIVALDMFPEDNPRRKSMMPPSNYTAYLNNERYGYQFQFTRNMLQLAMGKSPDGQPIFSEIGMMAGIAGTDWSWSPLAADYDLDGDRDLLITNGFPRDVTDRDFMDYNVQVGNIASRETLIAQIPSVKIPNYAYENTGGSVPIFKKVTESWGLQQPSLSNGAAFADLDNDGDLDYLVNNINGPSFLYQNNSLQPTTAGGDGAPAEHEGASAQVLTNNRGSKIILTGKSPNIQAIGARVTVTTSQGRRAVAFNHPVRGYLSSVSDMLHFGLGPEEYIDTITITWPNGQREEITQSKYSAEISIRQSGKATPVTAEAKARPLMQAIPLPDEMNNHLDSLFIDFNVQALLPHKLSEFGPGLAVADLDQDGAYDFFRTGSHFYAGEFVFQDASGGTPPSFRPAAPLPGEDKMPEDLGALFFDADMDGDEDLFLVSGGSELSMDNPAYQDRLFLNDGKGNFYPAEDAIPAIQSAGSIARAADIDRDGDLDLFVAGRLETAAFPRPVDSYLLLNDGAGNFRQAQELAFAQLGLVTDAIFTDPDQDGWPDLILVGQGMPVTLFENVDGKFRKGSLGNIDDQIGWWNSIIAADFDRDGDTDYLAGNLGHNNLYRQNEEDFVGLYAADFDKNGGLDLLVSSKAPGPDGVVREYPHHQRADTEKQLTIIKLLYEKHADFGKATMEEFLGKFKVTPEVTLIANQLGSAWLENDGQGKFILRELPAEAQVAPIFGLLATDVNEDGYPDIVAVGNDYGAAPSTGFLDGHNGLIMVFLPEEKRFRYVPPSSSGFYVPGDGRALVEFPLSEGRKMILASENQGPTRAFVMATNQWWRSVGPLTQAVEYVNSQGEKVRKEVYYGSGFLSQSARGLWLPEGAKGVIEIE